VVYPFLEGKKVRLASPRFLFQLGKIQGRMHEYFMNRGPKSKKHTWDPPALKRLMIENKNRLLKSSFPDAKEFLIFLLHELNACRLPKNLPVGFTHQDIKPENIIARGNQISGILDFDNAYYGVLLHDITTSIIWWCFKKNKLDRKLLRSFLQGYESVRPLTYNERKLLLTDGLKFRLIREMFIGPLTTLDKTSLAVKRARHFLSIYSRLFGGGEGILKPQR
jgi:Ser/Thr protein kinase RdoA (MazF antagonist)